MPTASDRMEAMVALREGVRALTRQSQEIDARLICALLAPTDAFVEQSPINGRWCIHTPTGGRAPGRWLWETPIGLRLDHESPTASIDAALALVERVLPGALIEMRTNQLKKSENSAAIYTATDDGESMIAATLPLAILDALLTALIETPEASHGS